MQTEEGLRWVKSPEKGEFCINSFKLSSSTSCFTYPYGGKLGDNKDSTQTHFNTSHVSFSSLPSSSSLAATHPRQRDGTECFFILTWMSGLGHLWRTPAFIDLEKSIYKITLVQGQHKLFDTCVPLVSGENQKPKHTHAYDSTSQLLSVVSMK